MIAFPSGGGLQGTGAEFVLAADMPGSAHLPAPLLRRGDHLPEAGVRQGEGVRSRGGEVGVRAFGFPDAVFGQGPATSSGFLRSARAAFPSA